MIEPAKFCSECGAALNARRAYFGWWRARCLACASHLRLRRVVSAAGLALLIILAFALGRLATPPRTVYLLGTPIEPLATVAQDDATSASIPSPTRATDETVSLCGAPTKSGKPCQRKVKGGGYCYQHRDKYGPKNANQKSQ